MRAARVYSLQQRRRSCSSHPPSVALEFEGRGSSTYGTEQLSHLAYLTAMGPTLWKCAAGL